MQSLIGRKINKCFSCSSERDKIDAYPSKAQGKSEISFAPLNDIL